MSLLLSRRRLTLRVSYAIGLRSARAVGSLLRGHLPMCTWTGDRPTDSNGVDQYSSSASCLSTALLQSLLQICTALSASSLECSMWGEEILCLSLLGTSRAGCGWCIHLHVFSFRWWWQPEARLGIHSCGQSPPGPFLRIIVSPEWYLQNFWQLVWIICARNRLWISLVLRSSLAWICFSFSGQLR